MKRITTVAAFAAGMIAAAGAHAATPAQTFTQMANTYMILQADLQRAQQDATALAELINTYHGSVTPPASNSPTAPMSHPIVPQPPHPPTPAGPMSHPVGPR